MNGTSEVSRLCCVALLFMGHQTVRAQSYLSIIPGTDQVTVVDSERIIHAHILTADPELSPAKDKFYNWFKSGKIVRTQGSYAGYLLEGRYMEAYSNKNLLTQGNYKNGLKMGDWSVWRPDGTLISIFAYKGGSKSGPFFLFDSLGTRKEFGHYFNGQLSGRYTKIVRGNKFQVSWYRHGVRESLANGGFFYRAFIHVRHLTGL